MREIILAKGKLRWTADFGYSVDGIKIDCPNGVGDELENAEGLQVILKLDVEQ